jgi:hypothetical protein
MIEESSWQSKYWELVKRQIFNRLNASKPFYRIVRALEEEPGLWDYIQHKVLIFTEKDERSIFLRSSPMNNKLLDLGVLVWDTQSHQLLQMVFSFGSIIPFAVHGG